MITSYSFDKDVDNQKISNYDNQQILVNTSYSLEKEVYVDNLDISNYDYQLFF